MKLAFVVGAAALVVATSAAGYANSPEFVFGRVGGNIQPYTVGISPSGALWSKGPVHLRNPDKVLSAAAQQRLLSLAVRERFFALPVRIRCADSLPDFAGRFVTVTTSTRSRTVTVRGGCNPRFQAVLAALETAAGVPLSER